MTKNKNFRINKISIISVFLAVLFIGFVGCSTKNTNEINSFEDCKKAGGNIAESYPRQCFIDNLAFTENLEGEFVYNVAPTTAKCEGYMQNQECLIIDGQYFYETIENFNFEKGFEYEIKVKKEKQFTDEEYKFMADVSQYKYTLIEIISKEKSDKKLEDYFAKPQVEDFVKGDLLVKIKDSNENQKVIEEIKKLGDIKLDELFDVSIINLIKLKVPEGREIEFLEKIEKIDGVEYVELNKIMQLDPIENPIEISIEDSVGNHIKNPIEEVTESFTGTIEKIENGKDGSSIILKNENGKIVKTVISIPNLGPNTDFDFSDIKVGNKLRVFGTSFEMENIKHITAKHAFTIYSKDKEVECLKNGGTYNKEGKLQAHICNMPAKDSGKICRDSTECEGMCLKDGKCSSKTINFGCIDILEQGKEVTICID